jgi:hypothetical protein
MAAASNSHWMDELSNTVYNIRFYYSYHYCNSGLPNEGLLWIVHPSPVLP